MITRQQQHQAEETAELLDEEEQQADESTQIKDSNGTPLEIGMRVGCRNHGEPVSKSRRGLTLIGYDPSLPKPYQTNYGSWALAIKDHQPDMDNFIKNHVS